MTVILKIRARNPESLFISASAAALREGKTVVFPTETVYGLGANALDKKAVKKIFVAKGRPSDNPLIVHIWHRKQLDALVKEIPPNAKKLMQKFWPGPLTILFYKTKKVHSVVTAGLAKVAIRMPSHAIAKALLKKANVPVAAPSANLSGKISPTHAEAVIDDLNGKVDIIIDGGDTSEGIESTVIDVTEKVPVILRPGTITKEQIEKAIGKVTLHPSLVSKRNVSAPASPGMKYRHYAPHKEMILASSEKIPSTLRRLKDKEIGLILTKTDECGMADASVFIGPGKKRIAKNIFKALRQMDKMHVDVIVVEMIDEKGIGFGIMNRLKKAASQIIE